MRPRGSAVQSRLARERTATVAARTSVQPERIALAARHRRWRIVPRRIVIVEILISRREAETTLSRQPLDRMPDQIRVAMVAKATRQTPHETVLVFDLAREERAAVTGKTPSLEIRLHSPLTGVLKSEALLFTLRHPVVVGLVARIGLVTDTSHSNRGHPGLYPVRNAG